MEHANSVTCERRAPSAEKKPILVLSASGPGMGGGFEWVIDTPDNRAALRDEAERLSKDYSNTILLAASVSPGTPDEITDDLDAACIHESGEVGHVLYRSPAWRDLRLEDE